MGRKKKRAAPNPYDRIFCYYCDRTFQNEQELLMHQREKHLRCPSCNKRMLSVPSLMIHASQMHNLTLSAVPNAVPGRDATDIDVLGMKGIPDEYYRKLEGRRKIAPVSENLPSAPRSTPALVQQPVAQHPATHVPQPQWSWPVHSSDPWSVAQNPMSFYPPSCSSLPLPPIAGVTPYPNVSAFIPYHQTTGSSPVSPHVPSSAHPYAYVPAPHPSYGSGSYPRQPVHPHRVYQQAQPDRRSFHTHRTSVTPQSVHSSVRQSAPMPASAKENTATGSMTASLHSGTRLHSNQQPEPSFQRVVPSGGTVMTTNRNPAAGFHPSAPAGTGKVETKLVFDNANMSVEELRAQLPRYKIKEDE